MFCYGFFCLFVFFTAMSVFQKKILVLLINLTTIAGKSYSTGELSKVPEISESTFEKPPTLEKHHI